MVKYKDLEKIMELKQRITQMAGLMSISGFEAYNRAALTEQLGGAEVEGHWSLLPPESWLGRPQRNHRACREGVRI